MTTRADPLRGTPEVHILGAVSPGRLHGDGGPLRLGPVSGGAQERRQGSFLPALHRPEQPAQIEEV